MHSHSDDDHSLAHLEQVPSQDTEWDEERRNREPIPSEADDVNALSLSVDRPSSYLGATSIKAAFLVMMKVAPVLKSFLAPPSVPGRQAPTSAANYPTIRSSIATRDLQPIPWFSDGQTLIDAYFNRVQIFVPMLDEPTFRADYLSSRRNDAPWLALLNMVFAMGIIVARKSNDHSHVTFYNRAKEHLGIDSFGGGHIETVQALSLMGGYYLHYINRPNMANAISGAALRMACAMGLHRESISDTGGSSLTIEQRRRTWWSLFCLDTWASTTLGRPSMGRWGSAITIRPPEGTYDPVSLCLNWASSYLTICQNIPTQHDGNMPLIENIKFCKIATQIQDLLAISPLLRTEDRASLDEDLVNWYNNLPWILRARDPCPESIHTARCVMKWRFQNLRIVLNRPVLLNLATHGQEGDASQEDLATVIKCREIAKQTIEDIAQEATPNQMLGWNGVWFMYQAAMIPLVTIFWESRKMDQVHECQALIEVVLGAFDRMADWSLAARRSREVVAKMYDASKSKSRPLTRQTSPRLGPTTFNPGGDGRDDVEASGRTHHDMYVADDGGIDFLDQQGVWDLDGMFWGAFPDGLDMSFDGMDAEDPMFGYDDTTMHQT